MLANADENRKRREIMGGRLTYWMVGSLRHSRHEPGTAPACLAAPRSACYAICTAGETEPSGAEYPGRKDEHPAG
jgi:hypothetical protein